uniref:[RNA-polymerase]-subunit kinase n=1 Tax=Aegilops tauschii subsp. strangulata TaxID=200361 RepID=A0A453SU33_AEGTS
GLRASQAVPGLPRPQPRPWHRPPHALQRLHPRGRPPPHRPPPHHRRRRGREGPGRRQGPGSGGDGDHGCLGDVEPDGGHGLLAVAVDAAAGAGAAAGGRPRAAGGRVADVAAGERAARGAAGDRAPERRRVRQDREGRAGHVQQRVQGPRARRRRPARRAEEGPARHDGAGERQVHGPRDAHPPPARPPQHHPPRRHRHLPHAPQHLPRLRLHVLRPRPTHRPPPHPATGNIYTTGIKCYMQQLLMGLQHCHERNILHRDIKGSNLLIDRAGVLKIGDLGLANYFGPGRRRPLTSRVVTLWYRAPELLLGATDYGVGIDLWSAGCLLAEMFSGKPLMPGRTEVEQLFKIFSLCGSPPDEYWRRMKLPATIRPPKTYKSTMAEKFAGMPPSAFPLLTTLLALDPAARGTAAQALQSDFFSTPPLACDVSDLPVVYKEEAADPTTPHDGRKSKPRQR